MNLAPHRGRRLSPAQKDLLGRIQSPRTTRYRVRLEGHEQAFVFCAYDALLVARLTGRTVRLEARPPLGRALAFRIGGEGPERDDLWHTFVEASAILPERPGMPSRRCPYLHVFERREDAQAWRDGLGEPIAGRVGVLGIGEAWRHARDQVASLADA